MTTGSKHGLGRGLGALIPTRPVSADKIGTIRDLPVSQIEPNPHQPRKRFAPDALDELAVSIREHGLIQPLLVTEVQTPYGARYQLIAGERRWRAAQRAGLSTVPAVVKGATSQQMLELALVENIQRADLNALEEAEAYQQLIREFELTQEEVAHKVGKDRTTVSNALRLLKMSPPLKEAVLNESISEGHARALMQIGDERVQLALLKQTVDEHLSVRVTEERVRRALANTKTDAPGGARDAKTRNTPNFTGASAPSFSDSESIEQDLRRALGTKVELYRSQRGGKIVIEFYSEEELAALYDKLVR